MPTGLFIGLPIAVAVVLATIAAVVMAPRLGVPLRILAVLAILPIAGFSVFGFAASFEPGDSHVIWRVMYTVVFLGCLSAIARLSWVKVG